MNNQSRIYWLLAIGWWLLKGNPMQKFIKMAVAMMALLAMPPEQRSTKKTEEERLMKDMNDLLTGDALANLGKDSPEYKALQQEVADFKKNYEATCAELKKIKSVNVVGSTDMVSRRPDGMIMRFSHPELSREFAEFCFRIARKDPSLTPYNDSEGGYLVPSPQIAAEIFRMVEAVGVAARIGRMIPMGEGGASINRGIEGARMYWKAAGQPGQRSRPTFGRLTMQPETLFGLIDSPIELAEDTMINIGDYIASEIALGMALEEDRVAFMGTGSPEDGGIVGILNSDRVTDVVMATGRTSMRQLNFDDITEMETAIASVAADNAMFLSHRTIITVVKQIKDNMGRMIWQPAAGNEPNNIIGYNYVRASQMPGTRFDAPDMPFMAFGNFSRGLLIGRRGTLRIEYSDHAGFESGVRVWRGMQRLDIGIQGYTQAEIDQAHAASKLDLMNPICRVRTAAA